MTAPDAALLDKLRAGLQRGPELRLAVLFGSRATGEGVQGSDVDIGFIPLDTSIPLSSELALARELSAASGIEVDLVRLDGAAPILGREAARSGVCLFEAEPGLFAAWRAAAMSEWIDFEEVIAPHRSRFLERLARGGRP